MTATKEQLQAELTSLGGTFDKRWGVPKLTEAIEQTKTKLKAVEEDLTGANKMLTEDIVQGVRTDDGVVRKSGIIIPNNVIQSLQKTRWQYVSDDSSEKSVVKKIYGKHEQYVREYSLQIHGPMFQQLAHQFVDKNNLR